MINKLLVEIEEGPLAEKCQPFITEGNDGAIAELFNKKENLSYGSLSAHDIRKYLILKGILLSIEDSSSIPCRTVTRALDIFPTFDLNDPEVFLVFNSILDALISDKSIPFSEQNKTELLYLGMALLSRAEELALLDKEFPSFITSEHIAQALRPGV